MANEKDRALVEFLFKRTEAGEIRWEPTAVKDQFTTSFKGKYNVLVDKSETEEGKDFYWLALRDLSDRELLTVTVAEMQTVKWLFQAVRRASLNVDNAIDEILSDVVVKPPSDDDIPF